jgi:hypothetical protein
MIWIALAALASAQAAEPPPEPQPPVYPAVFAPLLNSEREAAWLGPAGPYYPASAAEARQNGEAILICQVGTAGALRRCNIAAEAPRRFDFGFAAQRMADRKRITVAGPPPAQGEIIYVRVPFTIGAKAEVG